MKTTYSIPWYKKVLWALTPKDQYPDYWLDSLKSPIWRIKGIAHQLKKAYIWAKLGYKDRDFDQHYLVVVIHMKLMMMLKWWESGKHMTTDAHAKKVIRELKEVIKLIDRYQDDNYHEVAKTLTGFEEKYGKSQWVNVETGERSEFDGVKANTPYNIWGSKVFTDEQKRMYSIDIRKVFKKEQQLKEEDKRRICEIFTRHLEGWWD